MIKKNHLKTYITLNLDRNAVRAGAKTLNYLEARRLEGPIYEALIQEFNEQGCKVSAKYFRCLSEKEKFLSNQRSIRFLVQDDPKLLYQIFDYCREAEKAFDFQNCGGLTASFYIMYQLMVLIQDQGKKLEWLLKDVFKIIMKIIRHLDPKKSQPKEIIARIFYLYGTFLSKLQDKNSLKYLQNALDLCRGEKWSSDFSESLKQTPSAHTSESSDTTLSKSLHEVVVHSLAAMKIKFAKEHGKFGRNTEIATEMAKDAMLLVAEVGINTNKFQFFNAFISYAEYLKDSLNFHDAMLLLKKFHKYFQPEDMNFYSKFYCKQLMIRGCCRSGLKNIAGAKKDLQKAITIARQGRHRDLEAEALLNLALLYGLKKIEYNKGKAYYENARSIFLELGDRENEVKTHYLLAKLRADEMFPFLIDMLKATNKIPCNMHKLRRWKNICEPFWVDFSTYLQKAAEDPLTCLLEEEIEIKVDLERKEKSMRRLSITSRPKEIPSAQSFAQRSFSGLQRRTNTFKSTSTFEVRPIKSILKK